jgi:hypothetical protein
MVLTEQEKKARKAEQARAKRAAVKAAKAAAASSPSAKKQKTGIDSVVKIPAVRKVYSTKSEKWCAAAFEKYVGLLPEGARSNTEKRKDEYVKLFEQGSILDIDKLNNNNSKKLEKTINLSDLQLLDFLVHMWMDGIHDDYIDYNFRSFLEKNIKVQDNQIVYIFSNKLIAPVIERINDLAQNGTIGPYFEDIFIFLDNKVVDRIKQNISAEPSEKLTTFGTSWERSFKVALIEKYKIETTAGGIFNIKSPSNNSIYLSIDQEFKAQGERSLTKLVNMLNKIRKSHVSYNIETIGTLLDPGTTMLQYGTQNILSFMRFNKNKTDVDAFTTKFYFAPFHFIIKDTTGVTVSDIECKIDQFTGKLVVSSNGHDLKLPITKGVAGKANIVKALEKAVGKAKTPKAKKEQQDKLNIAIANRKAGRNTSGVTEYSKYMGDALQYMILAVSNPIRKITKRSPTARGYTYFCSGDSMALIGYDLMCKLCDNKEPRFIIDIAGAYSVEVGVSPQFKKDGFVIDFSKKVGSNMSVLTGEKDNGNKNESMVESNVPYYRKLTGQNNTLINSINNPTLINLFGTNKKDEIISRLSTLNTATINKLTELYSNNKVQFKIMYASTASLDEKRKAVNAARKRLRNKGKGPMMPAPSINSENTSILEKRLFAKRAKKKAINTAAGPSKPRPSQSPVERSSDSVTMVVPPNWYKKNNKEVQSIRRPSSPNRKSPQSGRVRSPVSSATFRSAQNEFSTGSVTSKNNNEYMNVSSK